MEAFWFAILPTPCDDGRFILLHVWLQCKDNHKPTYTHAAMCWSFIHFILQNPNKRYKLMINILLHICMSISLPYVCLLHVATSSLFKVKSFQQPVRIFKEGGFTVKERKVTYLLKSPVLCFLKSSLFFLLLLFPSFLLQPKLLELFLHLFHQCFVGLLSLLLFFFSFLLLFLFLLVFVVSILHILLVFTFVLNVISNCLVSFRICCILFNKYKDYLLTS